MEGAEGASLEEPQLFSLSFFVFAIFLKKKNTGDCVISLERGQSETFSSSDLESVFLFVLSFLVSTIFLKTKNPGEGMRR